MSIVGRPYTFAGDAPELQDVKQLAEELGRLALKSERVHRGITLSFGAVPGEVRITRSDQQIYLQSTLAEAPVLVDLLSKTLAGLGGRTPGDEHLEIDLVLPLTEDSVIQKTEEYRQRLRKVAGRMWMMVLGHVALALAIVGLITWVILGVIASDR